MEDCDLNFIVSGLAGELCRLEGRSTWTVREVKVAIHNATGIDRRQQRLIKGLRHLADADSFEEFRECGRVDLTLIRRSPEQALWLEWAETDWAQLITAPVAAWSHTEVVATAVSNCGWALRHAAEDVKANREVVLKAVKQNGLALQFASQGATADTEIALAAVKQCGRALSFVSDKLQGDRDFVLGAMRLNGRALEHARPAFRADREVVLAAVQQCGCALAGATTDLRSDHEVVIEAVIRDPGALVFAPKRVRDDPEILGLLPKRRPSKEKVLLPIEAVRPVRKHAGSICSFGNSKSDGHAGLASVLGAQGAALCEMANLGLPVVPGVCVSPKSRDSTAEGNMGIADAEVDMVKTALTKLEQSTAKYLGSETSPLLVSVWGGSVTVDQLSNIGINDTLAEAWALRENPRFVWDTYRRLIYSFARVVKNLDMAPFEDAISQTRQKLDERCMLGRKHEDCDIPTKDLKQLVSIFKDLYAKQVDEEFPQDARTQLNEAVHHFTEKGKFDGAQESDDTDAANSLILQASAFGNFDAFSATGLARLERCPESGRSELHGEWLPNAQREDLGSGRLRRKLTKTESQEWATENGMCENTRAAEYPSLEEQMPGAFSKLAHCQDVLSSHLVGTENVEFLVQQGQLWIVKPTSFIFPTRCSEHPAAIFDEPACAAIFPIDENNDLEYAVAKTVARKGDESPDSASTDCLTDITFFSEASEKGAKMGRPSPCASAEFCSAEKLDQMQPEAAKIDISDATGPENSRAIASTSTKIMSILSLIGCGLLPITRVFVNAASEGAAAADLQVKRVARLCNAVPTAPARCKRIPQTGLVPEIVSAEKDNLKLNFGVHGLFQVPDLKLPAWQTALAGSMAGAATQFAAGNSTACLRALPVGAICCTCYVNFQNLASPDGNLDNIPVHERFLCAGAAASFGTSASQALRSLLWKGRSLPVALGFAAAAAKRSTPAMAIEMCSIDVAKSAITQNGDCPVTPAVLVASGCVAGLISQSILIPASVIASNATFFNGMDALSGQSATSRQSAPAAPSLRTFGQKFRASIPGAAANSLVRVGMVSCFLQSQVQ